MFFCKGVVYDSARTDFGDADHVTLGFLDRGLCWASVFCFICIYTVCTVTQNSVAICTAVPESSSHAQFGVKFLIRW